MTSTKRLLENKNGKNFWKKVGKKFFQKMIYFVIFVFSEIHADVSRKDGLTCARLSDFNAIQENELYLSFCRNCFKNRELWNCYKKSWKIDKL